MTNKPLLIALSLLGITDAWLISHPNILGKLGIFVYKYSMIKTFPNALITVFITLGICYALAFFFAKNKPAVWAKYGLIIGLVLCIAVLAQVVFKFSGGTYKHTGASFRYGMILLPILMTAIFGMALTEKTQR